jgi:hypothetical protein
MTQQSEIVEVDSLSFLVRAQKFRIVATIMRRTTVPIVTEYATRLVHIVKGVTPEELGSFFDFEPPETRILLQDVLRSGLVMESNGALQLSQRGYEALSPMDDRFNLFDAEEIPTTISLDLIAFTPIDDAQLDQREGRIVEEVPLPDRQKAALASVAAREAFDTHFHEWRQSQTRRRDLDEETRLHSIEDVQPVRSFAAPIHIPVRCRLMDALGTAPDFSQLSNKGRPGSRNALIEALSRKIQSFASAADHQGAFDLVTEVDGGIFLRDGVRSSSDQTAWARLASDPDRQSILGASGPGLRLVGSVATESVRAALLEWTRGADASSRRSPIFWLPPKLNQWGRSVRFASLASALSETNAADDGTVLLARSDNSPTGTKSWQRLYGRTERMEPLFDRCLCVPHGDLPDALELIVKPGAWALVLIHAPDPRTGHACPFGYIVSAPRIVADFVYKVAEIASRAAGTSSLIWQKTEESADRALAMIDRALGIEVAD